MIVYHVSPIDFWDGWQTPDQVFLQEQLDDEELVNIGGISRNEWEPLWRKAQQLAKKVQFEGDVSFGPYLSVLPDPDSNGSALLIAWKQSNNGSTFIASPYPLTWLNGYESVAD